MKASDPVYRRGVRFLLETQRPDGSWHVKSRALGFQPYFESGYPYGHDQWVSCGGAAWATMALALSEEPKQELARR
jgi:squalene cyclase